MYDTTTIPSDDYANLVELELEEFNHKYDNDPLPVKCRICKAADTATRRQLETKGWALYGKGEFCPSH
ncbi:MAG: hypothetical protein PSX80_03350 [bacterium]|nr:hypothetical protein [bacterium]